MMARSPLAWSWQKTTCSWPVPAVKTLIVSPTRCSSDRSLVGHTVIGWARWRLRASLVLYRTTPLRRAHRTTHARGVLHFVQGPVGRRLTTRTWFEPLFRRIYGLELGSRR